MANDVYRIWLDGDGEYCERLASGAVSPGMLIEETSAANTAQAHSTSGGAAEAFFAIEDRLQGYGITDAYSSGARMRCVKLSKGATVYCRIANGQNIARADKLISNGAGYMTKYTAEASAAVLPKHPILVALEAVNMSGSSAVDPDGFCKAQVI